MNTTIKQTTLAVKSAYIIFFSLLIFSARVNAEVTAQDLPNIGDSSGTIMSPEYERRLGQAFLNQVRQQADIINDPEVETYIRSLGYRLVSQSDNNTQQFTFFIINEPTINAFAAPGGIVGINTGTILNSSTESELAGVLAHEVAHVTQRHMARSFEMQSRMSIPMVAAMLGAIILATQNAEAGQAALIAAQGASAQMQINFTRANEVEADRIGMQLLARAEFNPRGMPGFFEKLHQDSRYGSQAPEFLRTHPLTSNRIADTRSRAEQFPLDHEFHESLSYDFIKAKLIVLLNKDPYQSAEYFRYQLEMDRFGNNFAHLTYGHALALTEIGEYDQAREKLLRLLATDKENSTYQLALANLESRRENHAEAIRIYDDLLKLYPDYRPVVFSYARVLLENNRPARARDILREYGKYNEADIAYYQFLMRSEGDAGNQIEAGMASAEYYYLSGETQVAVQQIQHLLNNRELRPDFYQREKLQDRLAYMERELKIERDMKLRK